MTSIKPSLTKLRRGIASFAVPRTFRSGGTVRSIGMLMHSVLISYGWLRSQREKRCVDAVGNPIPWFTYPAIDFLSGLNLSCKRVFEWGSGNSTLFWGGVAYEVISVETSLQWYEYLAPRVPTNCLVLLSNKDRLSYVEVIDKYDRFDVIVIDGEVEHRKECCLHALEHIGESGIIILDNSDRCVGSTEVLRGANLIQVDFTGFAPLNVYAHTTSIFFTRGYDFAPRHGRQPQRSVAQPYSPWLDQ